MKWKLMAKMGEMADKYGLESDKCIDVIYHFAVKHK